MKKLILVSVFFIYALNMFSQQFSVNADLRIRYEMRNGYSTLRPDSASPANFVSQRSRIIFNYQNEKIKLRFSPQIVKVWGDVLTTSKTDLNNSMYEAYGEILVSKALSVKMGRQEINYDNARILGNVDWSMQGRTHDAIIFNFLLDSLHTLNAGIAYNANNESNFQQVYTLSQYKTMHYLRYHGKIKKINLTILGINNGMSYMDNKKEKVAFSQTIGLYSNYQENALSCEIAYYMQTGKVAKKDVNAINVNATIDYQITKRFKFGVGAEYLSGKSNNDSSNIIKAFNPLYGTNHKFNGYLDYFYVGNHINNVGLLDIYANINYKYNKFSLKIMPHVFQSAAYVYYAGVNQDKNLGTEIDLVMNYNLYKDFNIELGYSQIFATQTLEILKGGKKDYSNNWVYLMVKFNPQMFSGKSNLQP